MSQWSGEPLHPEKPGDPDCAVCDQKVRKVGSGWFHVNVTAYRLRGGHKAIRRHTARPKPVNPRG